MEGLERFRLAVGAILEPRTPTAWHRRQRVLDRVASLSQDLRFARGRTFSSNYLEDELTLRAYLAYFAPWNILRIDAVLSLERARRGFLDQLLAGDGVGAPPPHILDLGAGPLVFPLYLAIFHPQLLERDMVFHVVDAAPNSVALGEKILRKLQPKHQWTFHVIAAGFDEFMDQPDLVPWREIAFMVETFSLNEWARGRVRREKLLRLVSRLSESLPPAAQVLVIEPGNREAGRLIPALRAELIAAHPVDILAPCTHLEKCPLIRTRDRSWCHFRGSAAAPDWLIEVGHDAGLPKERLHASYLTWRHGARSPVRPRQKLPCRVLGDPMRLGAALEGAYGCDATGRVLLTWKQGERPPRDVVGCGCVVMTPRQDRPKLDPKSGARIIKF